jgi:hypothetical protein
LACLALQLAGSFALLEEVSANLGWLRGRQGGRQAWLGGMTAAAWAASLALAPGAPWQVKASAVACVGLGWRLGPALLRPRWVRYCVVLVACRIFAVEPAQDSFDIFVFACCCCSCCCCSSSSSSSFRWWSQVELTAAMGVVVALAVETHVLKRPPFGPVFVGVALAHGLLWRTLRSPAWKVRYRYIYIYLYMCVCVCV